MSKRIRQYMGIIVAIVVYYIIHEGAHLVVALFFHAFKKLKFMGIIGIQVDIYRDCLTNGQLGVFCIAGAVATLLAAYVLVYLKDRICSIESKILKAILYYVTLTMLLLDPVYLCLLSGWLGGGDLNGILYLMPQGGVWTLFGLILIYNLWLLIKKVTPVYSAAFNKN